MSPEQIAEFLAEVHRKAQAQRFAPGCMAEGLEDEE